MLVKFSKGTRGDDADNVGHGLRLRAFDSGCGLRRT